MGKARAPRCGPKMSLRWEFRGLRFTAVIVGTEEHAEVRLHLLGRQNVANALAALAVGFESGVSLEEGARALGEMRASERRGQVLEWRGARIVNDCYNSNPRALDAMVDALLTMEAKRRIAVAGEMLELGPEGPQLHQACGVRMAELGLDVVIGVRGLAKELADAAEAGGAQALFFATAEEAGGWLRENVREGDAVLVKGSRGVRLERALTVLVQ